MQNGRRKKERGELKMDFRILIIEDDQHSATHLKNLSTCYGLTPLVCENAEEALALVAHMPPDAILVDYCLPHMSGVQFIDELHKRQISIPTILISSYSHLAQVVKSNNITFYLKKPFSFHNVLEILRPFFPQAFNQSQPLSRIVTPWGPASAVLTPRFS